MPDWISHLLLGLIIAKLFRVKKKSLVLLGAILPDIIFQIYHLSLFFKIPENTEWLLVGFHQPFSLIIISLLIPFFFKYNYFKSFSLITIGWIGHVIIDILNVASFNHAMILLPFSWTVVSFGSFYIAEYLFYILLLGNIYLLLIIIDYFRYKKVMF
ncbi:MAG: hypothetical protein ABII01_06985 [Candidatus Woesearchaeota archaeon]